MSSSRNMAIVGLSIMLGIMIPTYIKETKNPINTGTVNFLSKYNFMVTPRFAFSL